MSTSVKIGPSTIVGYGLTAIASGIAAVEEFHGPGKWMAIMAGALAALTNLNRSIQAREQIKAGKEA